jgi:CRISPR-associated protein Csm5
MNYRVTCVTPTLVGDGSKLAPIDYMVWKDHVNILDQTRIFKLLAKGPRLEGYLAQLKRATKLDFASWGGFAQNFAGRRIPFENAAYAAEWERTQPENCSIPTFAAGATGSYLPGTAIKGALRTSMLASAWKEGMLADLPPRRPGEAAEQRAVGSRTRAFLASDSKAVADSIFRIYMGGNPYPYSPKWRLREVFSKALGTTVSFWRRTKSGAYCDGAMRSRANACSAEPTITPPNRLKRTRSMRSGRLFRS